MKHDNRTEKRKIGDLGENIACRFLMKHGFEVIEQNYLRKWGEIDIIARKKEKLHFIEVKSVSYMPVSYETDSYKPEDNLHSRKLERIGRTIQSYLLNYKPACAKASACQGGVSGETDWQFDVVNVYLDIKKKEAKVNYLENIIL